MLFLSPRPQWQFTLLSFTSVENNNATQSGVQDYWHSVDTPTHPHTHCGRCHVEACLDDCSSLTRSSNPVSALCSIVTSLKPLALHMVF